MPKTMTFAILEGIPSEMQRDAAFGVTHVHPKAPSPLRSAGAVQSPEAAVNPFSRSLELDKQITKPAQPI